MKLITLTATKAYIRQTVKFLSISVIVFLLPACTGFLPSHIHDAAAEKTATDLQGNLAAYREDQVGLYDSMAANLASFQAEEDKLVGRLTADFVTALVTKAPSFSWNELIKVLDDVDIHSANTRSKVLTNMKGDLEARQIIVSGDQVTKKSIHAYEAEIARKKQDAQNWEEAAQRYRAAMANLPSTIEGLTAKAKDISKLLSEVGALDQGIKKDLETRGIDPNKIIEAIKGTNSSLREQLSEDIKEAPGLTVLILELGLELAELDRRRAELALASLRARADVFEDTLVHLDIADELSKIARNHISTDDRNRAIIDEIQLQRDSDKSTSTKLQAVSNFLLATRLAVSADWLVEYQGALLDLRLSRIAHSESISTSQVNDEAWQATIGSGVDALAAYHQGGLKREDLANFFRLAQSIALFIIAT